MISTIITDADIVAIRNFSFLMNEHGKNMPKKIITPHMTDVSKCQIIIIIIASYIIKSIIPITILESGMQ